MIAPGLYMVLTPCAALLFANQLISTSSICEHMFLPAHYVGEEIVETYRLDDNAIFGSIGWVNVALNESEVDMGAVVAAASFNFATKTATPAAPTRPPSPPPSCDVAASKTRRKRMC